MRRRAVLVALLVAEGISSLGSRMSTLAIPWLVLVTTGSPTRMGIVALAQTLPFVLAGVVGAPVTDRLGPRLASILNDAASAVLLAATALFARYDFAVLVGLSALLGTVNGVGEHAKRVLLGPVADAAGVSIPRMMALVLSLGRVYTMVGVMLGGVVIAWLGPVGAIWFDAGSFAFCAVVLTMFVRIPATTPQAETQAPAEKPTEPYLTALRGGFSFLRRDRLILSVTGMMLVTNMFNQASAVVLVPLWVQREFASPVALGWVGGAFSLGAILGGVTIIGLIPRLPRYLTFLVGYLIGGAPRFLVLGLTDNLAVVLAVTFVSGIAISVINPLYGTLLYERVPRELQARVFGLTAAIGFGGIPLGGLVGAWAVHDLGLSGGLLLAGCLYFLATLSPVIGRRTWKQLDTRPADTDAATTLAR